MGNLELEPAYSLNELRELALEADMYVNEPRKLKQRNRRIKEVVPMLDEAAGPLYIGQPVRIFGIHGRAEFEQSTRSIRQYVSTGQVTGVSEGFSAVNYDSLLEHFAQGGDERHTRLLAELRERAVGSIGICHLVRRNIITSNSVGFLTSAHYINRAVSPVASSILYPERHETAILENKDRLDELTRILSASRNLETAELFSRMQESISGAKDAWSGLTECAEAFKELCGNGDQLAITAAHDYLQLMAGPRIYGRVYTFPEALPPSYIRSQGGTSILQFPEQTPHSFLLTNLAIASELEVDNNMIRPGNKRALFAVGHLYTEGAVDPSMVLIPVDKLKDQDYEVLGRAVSKSEA